MLSQSRVAKGIPIKLVIALVVVSSMLIVAMALTAFGWVRGRDARVITAGNSALAAAQLIGEQSHRLLDPGRTALRQLAHDPMHGLTTLEGRLQRLPVVLDELVANPLLASIYFGYEQGDFLLVRRLDRAPVRARFDAPQDAAFMVQSVTRSRTGKRVGEYVFLNGQREVLARRAQEDYQFDPRSRTWFSAALASDDIVFSAPYVFFSTRQQGITLSKRSAAPGTASVVGIDVLLDELAASLNALRITPGAHIALVDAANRVILFPDLERVLVRESDRFDFKTLEQLGEPSLTRLIGELTLNGKPGPYDVNGRQWLGTALPFDALGATNVRLLVTAPMDELLGDLTEHAREGTLLGLGIVLLLLPIGWWGGKSIGRQLGRLAHNAKKISRFDFSRDAPLASRMKEVHSLSEVMDTMGATIESFLDISETIAREPKVELMLEKVLVQFVAAARCTVGAVYLWSRDTKRMEQAALVGREGALLATDFVLHAGRSTRIIARDLPTGQRQSEFELRRRSGELQGLLVVLYQPDAAHADPAFTVFASRLSGLLAVSIETRELIDAQRTLFDAVIRLMADAIDAKSAYTGGHCERVPALAFMLVDRLCAEQEGFYANFSMDDNQRYEFYLGAWLHDAGKVTSPVHIVDKATKLETIYNRIHEIRMRFEVLWRDAEIACLKRTLEGADAADQQQELVATQMQLLNDFAFVAQCNIGSEFMADSAIARLRDLAARTWTRHFDNRLGLAHDELMRYGPLDAASLLPAKEFLLADRPDHLVPWSGKTPAVTKGDPRNRHGFDMQLPQHLQNMGELHNLVIRRGTLTNEDRFQINDHIVQTYAMLKALPWPDHLSRVPHFAATHHEKLDGTGYPRRLDQRQLSVLDRVMAIADVFEALTASDRPYKAPKTVSESLKIMAFMCNDRHIDTDLFVYFLRQGVWRVYAEKYLDPQQIDVVDLDKIEAMLKRPAEPGSNQSAQT